MAKTYTTLWEAFASGEGFGSALTGSETTQDYRKRTQDFYDQVIGPTFYGSGAENIGGKAVLIGIPAESSITVDPGNFMYFHKQYIGSLGATYPERDFDMYLQWHKEGKFPLDKLVTDRYTLEDIAIACDDLHNGKITGRAIVEF